jgi:hypothetical protein
MLNFKILSILAILMMAVYPLQAMTPETMTYTELDNKIIGAYNTNPRNTSEVYLYSILILKKSNKDKTTTGKAWLLKAKKLITVSCFYECTQAIDKKLYRNAFIWAKRGVKRGTTTGAIGAVSVKSLYKYLNFASSELKNTPMVKNSNPTLLQQQIDDYQNILHSLKSNSTGQNEYKLRTKLLKLSHKLLKQLKQDNDFIIVKLLPAECIVNYFTFDQLAIIVANCSDRG